MRETKIQMLSDISKEYKKVKVIDNNTLKIWYSNGDMAIRLHHTDIITFKKNGDIILNSGGWRTKTTKERINTYSPFKIYQKNNIWFFENYRDLAFYDNIIFNKDLKLKSEFKKADNKRVNTLKRKISKFINLLDNFKEIPKPKISDCWFCLLRTQEGKTFGEVSNDTDHLKEHIKEGYLFGSLIVNSLLYSGYKKEQIAILYSLNTRDAIKRALRKYLTDKLIMR